MKRRIYVSKINHYVQCFVIKKNCINKKKLLLIYIYIIGEEMYRKCHKSIKILYSYNPDYLT